MRVSTVATGDADVVAVNLAAIVVLFPIKPKNW